MPQQPGTMVEATDRRIGPYSAFVPNHLPPGSELEPGRVWGRLEKASRQLGALCDVARRLPNPDLLSVVPTVREAHASARVEGTTTTLAEALGFSEIPEEEQRRLDFVGVQAHLDAQTLALAELRIAGPDLKLLKKAHAVLVREGAPRLGQPGRFRSLQNFVPGSTPGIQNARYVPPPPGEVKPLMEGLDRFRREPGDLPGLVTAAMLHAQFEMIHPFADGNGRMGRLLILLDLLDRDLLEHPTLFLSEYFAEHRDEYFARLDGVSRERRWEEWIGFFLDGVHDASVSAIAVADAILDLHARLEDEVTAVSQGASGRELLDHLFRHPRTSVRNAARTISTSLPSVNTAVNRFVDKGWLRQVTPGRRNREFVFQPLWDALAETVGVDGEQSS
ncbi:MAG: Fic family protein [Armatimonadetes bacterium]|nr:MAG: Fic family protein [Armatimonadota bacterium]